MSERDLDSYLRAGAVSEEFRYVVMVHAAFPSGDLYVHNGVGTHTYDGNDYLGVGAFGSIEVIEENTTLVDSPIKMSLSSITQEVLDAIRNDDIYGRAVNIYVAALDNNDQLAGTPTLWLTGYMDAPSVNIGQDNGVSITIQTKAGLLKRRNNKRFTLEDHQTDYSGDKFFEFLPYLMETDLQWGGKSVTTGGGSFGGGGNEGNLFVKQR